MPTVANTLLSPATPTCEQGSLPDLPRPRLDIVRGAAGPTADPSQTQVASLVGASLTVIAPVTARNREGPVPSPP